VELASASQRYEQFQTSEKQRVESETKNRAQQFERVIADLAKDEGWAPLLVADAANKAQAEAANNRLNAARAIFEGKIDAATLAQAAIQAAVFNDVSQYAVDMAKRYDDLEKQLQAIKSATPASGSAGGSPVPASGEDPYKGMTAGQAAAAELVRLGVFK
jgi:septin family protein